MTHQGLFDAWVKAETTVIHEWHGDIASGLRVLVARAEAYAAREGLNTAALDDAREALTEYDEEDED